jgi:hypothetical protein
LKKFLPQPTQILGWGRKEKMRAQALSQRAGLNGFRKAGLLLFSDGRYHLDLCQYLPFELPRGYRSMNDSIRAKAKLDRTDRSFHDLVDLLAKILVLDFQAHREITVGSPPRNDSK